MTDDPRDVAPANTQPRRDPPWALIVGILVLGLVAAGMGAILLTREPDTSAATPSASSSARPSNSAATSASAAPTTQASASTPAQSSEPIAGPDIPDGLLPAGSVISVTADAVRIRSDPSTDAEIVATMAAGDVAYVLDSIAAGPVAADGYEWYEVEYAEGRDIWPWQDVPSADLQQGWMAAGTETERFVVLATVECRADPVTLETLAFEVTPWERLVCLANGAFTIEGTYGCETCADGVTRGANPTWLADAAQHAPISGTYEYYPFARMAVSPDVAPPADRDIVRATVHVNDDDAETCTYTPDQDESLPTTDFDPTAVEIYCRERLVIESFEVTGRDDGP